eukprot:14248120-Alexandrium_andersonii.AAC.1
MSPSGVGEGPPRARDRLPQWGGPGGRTNPTSGAAPTQVLPALVGGLRGVPPMAVGSGRRRPHHGWG